MPLGFETRVFFTKQILSTDLYHDVFWNNKVITGRTTKTRKNRETKKRQRKPRKPRKPKNRGQPKHKKNQGNQKDQEKPRETTELPNNTTATVNGKTRLNGTNPD